MKRIGQKRRRSILVGKRRDGTANTLYDKSLDSVRNSAENMLTVLGGRERVVEILTDSSHPKAQRLIERLTDKAYIGENFATSYSSVGMKLHDLVEIFSDVQQGKVFIQALNHANEVVMSLVRAASDQIELHEKCNGTGWVLNRDGDQTDNECRPCRGSGYILKSGARDAQDLYLTFLKWKQSGGGVMVDARRQQVVVQGGGMGMVAGALPGKAPEAHQIIKRADQLMISAPPAVTEEAPNQLPEDVLEAEPV